VLEDPSAGSYTGLNYRTFYAYDGLDDLVTVCQNGTLSGSTCSGGLPRTFQYDSLKRLSQAISPLTGAAGTLLNLGYDYGSGAGVNNGNLRSQTIGTINVAQG
jgi:hypothetical protein